MDALESRALPPEAVLVGPAGTGKTFAVLLLLHLLSLRRGGLRILVARRTRESLTESVLVTYEQEVLGLTGHGYIAEGIKRRVRQSYTYPNGTSWVVGGMDRPSKILSTAFDIAFINEVTELDKDGWETLGSRLDRPGRSGRYGWLLGDTNPGDPSHWLKARIDDGTATAWPSVHADNPLLHDGTDWTEKGRAYRARLGRLTGTRAKRLFLGLWAAGEGQWFESFGERHVSTAAEFDPRWPVTLAVDSGVHTGAVWFQVRETHDGPMVTVFADYYAFNLPAFANAEAILARGRELCGGRWDRGVTDPAGSASNPIGPTVLSEFERAGLRKLAHWPKFPGSVADGLALVESFVSVDPPGLLVHPRCSHLLSAFANYRRARRGGQYIDRPEDDQNPHEDLMDALRGGLQDRFPAGRKPAPVFQRRSVSSLLY